MKTVPLIAVSVRRDAMTTLAVTVPAHEISVMRMIFGGDNVQQKSDDPAGSVELDPAVEGARLAEKYGLGPVKEAFGGDYQGAVIRAMSEFDAAAKPTRRGAAT